MEKPQREEIRAFLEEIKHADLKTLIDSEPITPGLFHGSTAEYVCADVEIQILKLPRGYVARLTKSKTTFRTGCLASVCFRS